jgi:hypothetical protein
MYNLKEGKTRTFKRQISVNITTSEYRLGFDILSITSMEENIPSHSLQPFVSTKRLT